MRNTSGHIYEEIERCRHNNTHPPAVSALRTAQLAIAGAALALLAACGGGGDDNNNASNTPPSGVKMQVVSFGDSLSDAGTYSQIKLGFGGGRFTTNPGQGWTQNVAQYYGDTLQPANQAVSAFRCRPPAVSATHRAARA